MATKSRTALTIAFMLTAVVCLAGVEVADLKETSPTASDADPQQPPPPVPKDALFVGDWGDVTLKITADPKGVVQKVAVLKASRIKVFDERIRLWVEKNWRMPADLTQKKPRTFIAPIVFPRETRGPDVSGGGKYPSPQYPWILYRKRVVGVGVGLQINVARSGKVESTRLLVSSSIPGVDEYTRNWVQRKWQFPPADEERCYTWRCEYRLQD